MGATTVTLSSTSGLTVGNPVQFSNNSNIYTLTNISGNTITFSPSLPEAILASTSVVVPIFAFNNTSCNTANSSNGIATYFNNSLPSTTGSYTISGISGTIYGAVGTPTQVKGQYYWLLRNQTIPSAATDKPYSVLQLKYVVQPGTISAPTPLPSPNTDATILNPASTLSTSYTEVIPYASLQCPSQ